MSAARKIRIDLVHANLPDGGLDTRRRAAILGSGSGGADLLLRLPTAAPPAIIGPLDDALAAPGVVEQARAAAADGADAVVINCTAETGLAAAREAVSIPVMGVAGPAFHLAALLGRSFSVVTFSPRIVGRFRDQVAHYGLSGRLASVRVADLDLAVLPPPEEIADRLIPSILGMLRSDGAEVVVLGCTDFEQAAQLLRAKLPGVPIICPLDHALRLTEDLIAMGLGFAGDRSYPA